MTDRDLLLKRVMAVNPFPATVDLPEPLAASRRPASDVLTDLIPAVEFVRLTEDEPITPRRWKVAVVAVAGAVVVLVVLGFGSLLFGGADTPSRPVAPSVIVTTLPSTTVPPIETQTDPWGLSTVTEPVTQSEVNLVFLAMPEEINSMQATRDDPEHVGFVDYEGDGSHASIAWFEAGPNSVAVVEFLASTETSDGFSKETGGVDLDAPFVWLAGRVDEGDREFVLVYWGDPTDGSIFVIEADSVEHRDALVDAYITSAETPAPPPTRGQPSDSLPAAPDDEGWIGREFTAGSGVGWVGDEFVRLDGWREDPDALPNVGNWPVRLLVDGEPIDLWPWHVGSHGSPGTTTEIVVVGMEPNPYALSEYEIELEGAEPAAPDPDAVHVLGIWVIQPLGQGRYLTTDVAPLERSGQNMGYGALVNVSQQYDLCRVDSSIDGDIYAYFDQAPAEMETYYPATLAFRMIDQGEFEIVDSARVSCILNPDWQTRGY